MYSPAFCRGRHFPRYLLLVRDLRHVLVSHFEKWRHLYHVDFATFLRGDPWGLRSWKDIWREIEFLNTWGGIIAAGTVETRIVRYEQTRRDTAGTVASVCDYFHIPATPEICAHAAEGASKENMAKRSKAPRNATIVRSDPRHPFEWYSDADRAFFQHACRRHLRHDFGYNYEDWSR